MPRLTRSKQSSTKASEENDPEPQTSKKSLLKTRNGRSVKGIKEKPAAIKKLEEEPKRTRLTKSTTNEKPKIVRTALRRLKTAPDEKPVVKSSRLPKPLASTSTNKTPDVVVTETEQDIQSLRPMRQLRKKIDVSDSKLTSHEPKNIEKNVDNQKVEIVKKTRAKKAIVSDKKLSSPSTKSSDNVKKITKRSLSQGELKNQSPRQSPRNVSKRISNVKQDKKFFKSKLKTPSAVVAHSKISPLKAAVFGLKRKTRAVKKTTGKIPVTRESTSLKFRQTTLNESFAKQTKKTLRPRKTKNYHDDSVIDKKNSSNKEKSIVISEDTNQKKRPVYKTLQQSEEHGSDKDEVYDFKYDCNDSKERVNKKRKKKIIRKPPAKRQKKIQNKASNIVTDTVQHALIPELPTKVSVAKPEKTNSQKIPTATAALKTSSAEKNDNKVMTVVAEVYATPSSPQASEDYNPPSPIADDNEPEMNETPQKKVLPVVSTAQAGPRIISNEILDASRRIDLTVTPLKPTTSEKQFRPFRATNAFSMRPSTQVKTMMNHSLLRKSFSPIAKELAENFDAGSPWRPVLPTNTFSRVKNIFQSTPQGKKFSTLLDKASTAAKNAQTSNVNMEDIPEHNEENSITSKIDKSTENSPPKLSKSPRKFGTEISNIITGQKNPLNSSKSPRQFGTELTNVNSEQKNSSNPINTSKSPRKFGVDISNINNSILRENVEQRNTSKSPKKIESDVINKNNLTSYESSTVNCQLLKKRREVEIQQPTSIENLNEISPFTQDVSASVDIVDEKENSAPNCQSPLKSLRTPSPRKPLTVMAKEDENSECQPSEKLRSKPSPETWKLTQSNLHKFLNLPDMPEGTRITTTHGIFDDVHSTPITEKPMRKLPEKLDVEDAFGFNDDLDTSSEINLSPIEKVPIIQMRQLPKKTVEKRDEILLQDKDKNKSVAKPTRIAVGERKRLRSTTKTNKVDEEIQTDFPMEFKEHNPQDDVVQAVNFLDTFDYESQNDDDKEAKEEDIPLFVDLEPVHFKEPPRYSYKRHRTSSLSTSGELDEDEVVSTGKQKRPTKKKRIDKAQREQKKKLDEWAKSLNKTFDEIEDFDLVVEPISDKPK